jgi:hypothetical protein
MDLQRLVTVRLNLGRNSIPCDDHRLKASRCTLIICSRSYRDFSTVELMRIQAFLLLWSSANDQWVLERLLYEAERGFECA